MERMPGSVEAHGRTAQIYNYGPDHILKMFREGIPRSAAEQEHIATRFALSAGLPVPRTVSLTEWQDLPAIVYERVPGAPMLRLLQKQPWRAREFGSRLAKLHISVHQTDAGAGTGSGLPSLFDLLERQIHTAPLLSDDEKKGAIACLERLPTGHKLCHGDFHPDNVMLSGDRHWVIDWMTAVSGHPAADAARTVLLLRTAYLPDDLSLIASLLISSVRSILLRQYMRVYLHLSGLDARELEQWMLPLAAARLNEFLPSEEKLILKKLVQDGLARTKNSTTTTIAQ
ncbi:Phosphotransferase enzyme family protein [Paenibacillaceae bacterium GAS479]|nr:Phosphotransferase enzyme family protein [Paenibacillaceae bacterium GAS479]